MPKHHVESIKIDGKWYHFYDYFQAKYKAQEEAKRLRERDNLARMFPTASGGWVVYKRRKS